MRKIYRYIICVTCLAVLFSCSENLDDMQEKTGVISITLSSSNLSTRATESGVDVLNENAINSIHYFLYASGQTGQNALKWGSFSDLSAIGNTTVNVNVTEDELNNIFNPNTNKCEVFLIVNLPSTVNIDKNKTSLDDLEALTIDAYFNTKSTQESFVMTGLGTVNLDNSTTIPTASGSIYVDRVASKISITAKVAKSIMADGHEWVSDPSSMQIQFCKSQSKAVLSGDPSAVAVSSFNYEMRTCSQTSEEADFTICNWDPFYSYPKTWNSGDKDAEPYLLIELPWSSDSGETKTYKPCYYKVFLSSKELVRNTWYDITLTLSELGSFTETGKVITDLEYKVCGWSSFEFSAEIQDARYLVVDQNKYVMNNVNTLEIPFLSSHDCELVNEKVTKRDIIDGGDIDVTSGYNLNIVGSNIVYSKVLDNVYTSKTFDFVPYTITLTIRHKDDTNFTETITITQYPAIYGLDDQNSDYADDGNKKVNDHNGYAFVNGYNDLTSIGNQDLFANCPGLSTNNDGSASNPQKYSPNMYVFTVTNLTGTPYIIGDPRTEKIDEDLVKAKVKYNKYSNPSNSAWVQAPALYDGKTNRGLRYYYPTDGSPSTRNMIAPKFRIASSYAVLTSNTYEAAESLDGMRKRCASYQEDGYPAGRWRLPTEAEFKFILSQVDKKSLPPIYNPNTTYWCAHGLGTPKGSGVVDMVYTDSDTDDHSTRCVYDEWYWGSEPALTGTAKSTFTWGDMPRKL